MGVGVWALDIDGVSRKRQRESSLSLFLGEEGGGRKKRGYGTETFLKKMST